MEKVVLSWSSGKDSALALYEIRRRQDCQVAALLTTVTEEYDRVSMHGVRRALLEQQARALGLPLHQVILTPNATNEEYEARMREALLRCQAEGVSAVVFGDIFLADLRRYREENLARIGMKAVFPLWQSDTAELMQQWLELGFRAVTTCVDTTALGREFVGREIDQPFLASLPATADPCGENGEFHSFVYDGPVFASRIRFEWGATVLRDNRFYYRDLIPVNPG